MWGVDDTTEWMESFACGRQSSNNDTEPYTDKSPPLQIIWTMCTEKFSFFLLKVFIVCVYIYQSSLKWYQSCKKKWLDCCRITQQKKYILYVRRPLYMCEWVITLARLGHHSGAEFQAKNKREPSERERERKDEGEVFPFKTLLVDLWGFVSGQQR